ncbi:MAG: hypothetical protein ACHREM_02200 [Polyangiales bacterium]
MGKMDVDAALAALRAGQRRREESDALWDFGFAAVFLGLGAFWWLKKRSPPKPNMNPQTQGAPPAQHPFVASPRVGDGGFGFIPTDGDVRRVDKHIQYWANEIEWRLMDDAKTKYGPHGFAATVNDANMPRFTDDRDFYQRWRRIANPWAALHQEIKDTSFFVMPGSTLKRMSDISKRMSVLMDDMKNRGFPVDSLSLESLPFE